MCIRDSCHSSYSRLFNRWESQWYCNGCQCLMQTFGKFKRGAWFFNSSRGEVTDTNALKKVLCAGKLAGVVIDVWENEPDIDPVLLQQAYIATPHIAGYSTDGKANGTAMVVNALCRYFNLPL